jgi:hypothetical protein
MLTAQRVQAIHNAADPELNYVNVRVKAGIIVVAEIDSIAFRSATPMINAPFPGATITVEVMKLNGQIVLSFPITLQFGKTYIGMFSGVINPANFAANPEGRDISLGVSITQDGRSQAANSGEVDLILFHGSTDLPTVDLKENTITLVDNATYTDISNYFQLLPSNYTFDITDQGGSMVLYSYQVDLSNFADSALTLFASGFKDPSANQNGEPFKLLAVTPGGTLIEFNSPTSISENQDLIVSNFSLSQNYPNPFNPVTTIGYQLNNTSQVKLQVFNQLGESVRQLVNRKQPAGSHSVEWNGMDDDGNKVASGIYIYQLNTNQGTQSNKMLLLK